MAEHAGPQPGHPSAGGHDEVFDPIMAAVHAAFHQSGRAAFLLGPPGSGKTAFLAFLEDQVLRRYGRVHTAAVDVPARTPGTSCWSALNRSLSQRGAPPAERRPDLSAVGAIHSLLGHQPDAYHLLRIDGLEAASGEDVAAASVFLRHLEETHTFLIAAVATTEGDAPPAIGDIIANAERQGRAAVYRLGRPAG